VWPRGLTPLVDAVHGLGMDFGLWVEPEMVNPDSDLARAHPEWVLQTGGRLPTPSRHQQVLDLGSPARRASSARPTAWSRRASRRACRPVKPSR